MRLLTCRLPGESLPIVGLLVDGRVVPLRALAATGPGSELDRTLARLDMVALLAADPGLERVGRALAGAPPEHLAAVGLSLADVRLEAPVQRPGKIVCVGQNYRRHIEEQGIPLPDRPVLFAKFGNTVVGDLAPVVRPAATRALDLEAEMGVVIGRRAHRVAASAALEHVAGYTVVNDVSARDLQGQRPALREGEHGDGQWLRAKGADTFLPLGPLLVTPDELPDTRRPGLEVRSWRTPAAGTDAGCEVLMQEGRTDDMVWDVPALIEYISATITLEAGDVIATGTPPGVGVWRTPPVFLEPGDVVRVAIDGIGSLTDPIVDADGAAPAGSPAQVILEASAAARPGRA